MIKAIECIDQQSKEIAFKHFNPRSVYSELSKTFKLADQKLEKLRNECKNRDDPLTLLNDITVTESDSKDSF
jgi:septation ring formation regulator EzrA